MTIGDERYEFDLVSGWSQCITMGGAIGGAGNSVEGNAQVDFTLPPEGWESLDDDWEPPYLRVDDDDADTSWRAGDEVVMGWDGIDEDMSEVTSYTIDGRSASGTAMFVDLTQAMLAGIDGSEIESVSGTFEISCG